MRHRHLLFLLLAIAAIAAAGDQAGPTAGEGAPTEEAPTAQTEPAPAPGTTPDPEEQLEEFVPTEEVPAETAVAFPIDI